MKLTDEERRLERRLEDLKMTVEESKAFKKMIKNTLKKKTRPNMPISPYQYFVYHNRRASGDRLSDLSQIAYTWNGMSDEQKDRYWKLAEQDRKRYEIEMNEFKSVSPTINTAFEFFMDQEIDKDHSRKYRVIKGRKSWNSLSDERKEHYRKGYLRYRIMKKAMPLLISFKGLPQEFIKKAIFSATLDELCENSDGSDIPSDLKLLAKILDMDIEGLNWKETCDALNLNLSDIKLSSKDYLIEKDIIEKAKKERLIELEKLENRKRQEKRYKELRKFMDWQDAQKGGYKEMCTYKRCKYCNNKK